MHMYSRAVRITGQDQEMMRLAGELTRIVNSTSGLDMTLWQQMFGTTPGVIAWTAMTEGRASFYEEVAKFAELPEWQGLVEDFRQNATTPVDGFRWILNYDDDWAGPPNVAGMAMSQAIAPLGKVIEWSIEHAAVMSDITGSSIAVGINTVGAMGQITWHFGADSLEDADELIGKIGESEEWMERMDEATEKRLFAPGVGGQWIYRRVD